MKRLLLLVLLIPAAAAAQPDDESVDDGGIRHAVKYRERDVIDFDRGLEVEGELLRPQIGIVDATRRPTFNPLIRLRSDWREETLRSVDAVK